MFKNRAELYFTLALAVLAAIAIILGGAK